MLPIPLGTEVTVTLTEDTLTGPLTAAIYSLNGEPLWLVMEWRGRQTRIVPWCAIRYITLATLDAQENS